MYTASSKSQRHGYRSQRRRVVGLVSATVLVLTLSGGVNARQLRLDSPETRATYEANHDHMILMLKLRTNAGHQVLVFG